MIGFLITFIRLLARVLLILVIADVILSYFMPPYNRIREILDRLVEPMQAPIRRILPQTGMIDFSPLVLIILIQIAEFVLVSVLSSLR